MQGSQFIDFLIPLVSHFVLGPAVLVISIIFLKFPPKEINPIYGYRTKKSMQSQKHWDFANREFAKYLFVSSLFTMIVQISCSLLFEHLIGIFMGLISLIIFIILAFYNVENKLKTIEL